MISYFMLILGILGLITGILVNAWNYFPGVGYLLILLGLFLIAVGGFSLPSSDERSEEEKQKRLD